jgi:hypothetical protein
MIATRQKPPTPKDSGKRKKDARSPLRGPPVQSHDSSPYAAGSTTTTAWLLEGCRRRKEPAQGVTLPAAGLQATRIRRRRRPSATGGTRDSVP